MSEPNYVVFETLGASGSQVQKRGDRKPINYTFPFLFQKPSIVVVDHEEKMCSWITCRGVGSITFRFLPDLFELYIGEQVSCWPKFEITFDQKIITEIGAFM